MADAGNRPRWRLAIFDFDGTLADSAPWFRQTFNEVARRFRFRELGPDEMEALRDRGAREILRQLGIPWWKLPLIARYMRRRAAADIGSLKLFPGVAAMIASLRDCGVVLAVVSSNAEANVRRLLGAEITAEITHFACGVSLLGKTATFRRVLRRSGLRAQEAIAIGDEIRDIEAATGLGLASGAVTWGYSAPAALRAGKPTLVFSTMDEIAPAVAGRTAMASVALR